MFKGNNNQAKPEKGANDFQAELFQLSALHFSCPNAVALNVAVAAVAVAAVIVAVAVAFTSLHTLTIFVAVDVNVNALVGQHVCAFVSFPQKM